MAKRFLSWSCLLLLLTFLVALTGCGNGANQDSAVNTTPDQTKLGIIQIAEHPALDAARKGFLDTLKTNGYEENKNLIVDYQNAQNDQTILQTIAKKLVADQNDLILAIATPSAQAIAAETDTIPILITAVTDPVTAKLVQSADKPGTNITGTNDMNPIKEQLELLKQLAPRTTKVGVLYNAGEVNSQVQVDKVKAEAKGLGLEVVEATVSSSSEVLQAAQSLVGRVQAIYVPTDNTVVSAAESVIKVAEGNNLPVIAGEASVVERGGLATIGIDYYKLGKQTGDMALRVLKGEKPEQMAIESQKDLELVINLKAAEKIKLDIPDDLKKQADRLL